MERSLGLGRVLDMDPLEDNECVIMEQSASMIQLAGKNLTFKLNLQKFLDATGGNNDFNVDNITQALQQAIPDNITITADNFDQQSQDDAVAAAEAGGQSQNTIDTINAAFVGIRLFSGGEDLVINTTALDAQVGIAVNNIANTEFNLTVK